MLFEASNSSGDERRSFVALVMATLLMVASLAAGCATHTGQPPPAPVTASAVASRAVAKPAAGDVMTLSMNMRLRNDSAQRINLFSSTRCAVFRWTVVDAKQKMVQSKPNRLCAQAVASDTLLPNQQHRQLYEVALDAKLYTAGNRYRLRYQFWNYAGHHDFTVTGATGN